MKYGRGRHAPPLEERFWMYAEKSEGCWIWKGQISTPGYGVLGHNYKRVGAHRVSWEIHNGPISNGLWVLHKCDVRACVNPDHLFLGTQTENMRDAVAKGRHVHCTFHGEDHPEAKATWEKAREVRRLSDEGLYQREIADRLGLTRSCVNNILRGLTWVERS